ncbi:MULTISPECIES: glucose 1-dehydrogenase [Priestia]|jgi:2-deoxy-D-gluconate 3-dehydrogenase|uniref:glucose 1-dehydrogenase [NAD(P)(+)] n=4 Tax=Priestia TaxID=2800373 RepID=D5DUX3_PRIM1|nr:MULTISPECIES: glucose 1-dehydrogenase [Priestia]KOP74977.1 3-ketoacyl-ACP reductase [Bacillus sp. FJAT-21351]KQU11856.1 2-deoxy-D-gluconate 3-dehydrogenase [Bacillus sp. Leaf75]KRF56267.1 2-deoxy-D-gluconate 3-dehydrogenase [Bacillus sp. Soil531]MBZ5480244.1 SDR family oxidoreductase [Bacillus sp. T_4]MCF6796702.1 SDR family oxidoreductase [Bacillus sp. ET1]MCJ7985856.1 SDR family oxidoreductase [Priestia sp. OVL9]MDH6654176.1 2-deoxy-D-gluconate 3-dehydrogenase [Bacillus sp. PvP124]MDP9
MTVDLFSLDGKVAAITGATRGIGRSMAIALAEAGSDIALLQRSKEFLGVKEEIERLGRKCFIVNCDLENASEVSEAISSVVAYFGKLDILVNNAGIQRRSPAVDFAEEDWDAVMNVNLKTVWLLCQQAGRQMLKQGSGKIINMASLLSYQGGITVPAYAAAKGGVAQLTKALSNEWAAKGVNVNGIVPGYIATDMNEALINDETRSRQIIERIPAGRWGQANDFKGAVVFLASDASAYIHGHLLAVDGGWLGR